MPFNPGAMLFCFFCEDSWMRYDLRAAFMAVKNIGNFKHVSVTGAEFTVYEPSIADD